MKKWKEREKERGRGGRVKKWQCEMRLWALEKKSGRLKKGRERKKANGKEENEVVKEGRETGRERQRANYTLRVGKDGMRGGKKDRARRTVSENKGLGGTLGYLVKKKPESEGWGQREI